MESKADQAAWYDDTGFLCTCVYRQAEALGTGVVKFAGRIPLKRNDPKIYWPYEPTKNTLSSTEILNLFEKWDLHIRKVDQFPLFLIKNKEVWRREWRQAPKKSLLCW